MTSARCSLGSAKCGQIDISSKFVYGTRRNTSNCEAGGIRTVVKQTFESSRPFSATANFRLFYNSINIFFILNNENFKTPHIYIFLLPGFHT